MKLSELNSFKVKDEKITCLTAYDASFAKLFDDCGVDAILVGDSLGNVIQGSENTLGVTMGDMIYHTQAVAKSVKSALLIADMPYRSYDNAEQTLKNAQSLMSAGAQMVKFEGGAEHEASFKILQENSISVCGHLGLQPQSVIEMGGYKVQGRDESSAQKILDDALLLESLGVSVLVLECVPAQLAAKISKHLTIPTIGIGAGVNCDGQVLVSYDMLGINTGRVPKFVKNFLIESNNITTAVNEFIRSVKTQEFPTDQHSY